MVKTKDIINNGIIQEVFFEGMNAEGKKVFICTKEYNGVIYYLEIVNGKCARKKVID